MTKLKSIRQLGGFLIMDKEPTSIVQYYFKILSKQLIVHEA